MIKTKICGDCGRRKKIEKFNLSTHLPRAKPNTLGYWRSDCRACQSARSSERVKRARRNKGSDNRFIESLVRRIREGRTLNKATESKFRKLTGYSVNNLKPYIESGFRHKLPAKDFELADPAQFRMYWSLGNLEKRVHPNPPRIQK